MEARRLLLHRYTNRLPTSVPWVCSRESPAGRTDIFVIDPAWDLELAETGPLIHTAMAATLARAPRALHRRKPIEVTVLLGDNVMNSELHRKGWGHSACMAMLCFAELPVDWAIGQKRTGSTCLGGLAFAREAAVHQAQTKQLSVARHLASLVIHGTLALLGYVEGDETHTRLAYVIEGELSSDGAAGDGDGGSALNNA